MINVLIADDEQRVAQLIKDLIDWDEIGMRVVGLARNGEEAFSFIESQHPDIVVTDIRMPGCGGIELIQRARALNPSPGFIIISGYRHFEYAHSAIKYGVSDYLLKPIKAEELRSTLLKLRREIETRTSRLSAELQNRREMEDSIRLKRLELFRIIMGPVNRETLTVASLNENFGYHFSEGCFRIILLKIDGDYDEIYSDGLPVYRRKCEEIMRSVLTPLCSDLGNAWMGTTAAFLIGFSPQRGDEISFALREAFDDIRVQNNIFLSAVFTMAVGPAVEVPADLPGVWAEVEALLSERLLQGGNTLYFSAPERAGTAGVPSRLAEVSRTLESAMEVMEPAAMNDAIRRAMDQILSLENLSGKDVIYFSEMILNTYLVLGQRLELSPENEEEFRADFAKRAAIVPSARELSGLLRETIVGSFEEILKKRGEMSARPIRSAKQYIRDQYSKPLTLEDVAAREGFNASYFSTLFKKETGMTFSEYLHDVRMDEAKRLLRDTNMAVASVCENVGYLDLKHFTASFKRSTGIKPSEFRKLYSWREA